MGDQAVPAGRIRSAPRRGFRCCAYSVRSPSATSVPHPWSWKTHQSGQGRARRPRPRPRAPLPARRGDALGRRPGDSFGLSRLAAERHDAEYVVFCGVHFMAESADILTADHQQVLLPDLNAGCSMADMADLESVQEAWESLAAGDRHRPRPADHLHELLCRAQGVRRPPRWVRVHLLERQGGARVGPLRPAGHRPGRQGPVLPRPAPGPQHRLPARVRPSRTCGSGTHGSRLGRPGRGRHEGRHPVAVAGTLLGSSTLPARAHRRLSAAEHPGGIVVVHPECAHDVVESPTPVGLDRTTSSAYVDEAAPRLGDRRRYRDPPRQAARRRAPRTRRSCPSTRSCAPARPCSASTRRTCAGFSSRLPTGWS